MYALQISNLWAGMELMVTQISPIAAVLTVSMLNKQRKAVKNVNGQIVNNALNQVAAWNANRPIVCSILVDYLVVPNTATVTTMITMVLENRSSLMANVNTSKTVEITTTQIWQQINALPAHSLTAKNAQTMILSIPAKPVSVT